MTDEDKNIEVVDVEESDNEKLAETTKKQNNHLRKLFSSNYIEYASYVIKDRAIPEIKDGLKPVQRRIMWSLIKMDDGKFHKVANTVGYCMQFHPHGDASIYQALVNLANKDYFIEKQGNFGNIFTGDAAAAARYIEARLSPLGKDVLVNNDITEFVESYDGRNNEPTFLPAKIPVVLMLGQEGIAPGMTTNILPHNFVELLNAQISVLKGEDFILFPDFIQGGTMDVSEYDDGKGKVIVRAQIDIEGRKLFIRQIPPYTTTEKLIASIEKADSKGKFKLSSINDYTAEEVEIEIIPARGYSPEKTLNALYAYTDCSMSVSSSILAIDNNRPYLMTVSEIVEKQTRYLVMYLIAELNIELNKANENYHQKTLERIFIENRVYKRIEECETAESVKGAILDGLEPYLDLLKREVNDKDLEHLLAIPIRKISKFDINKNKKDIEDILKHIEEIEKNLKNITKYSIKYLTNLINKYGDMYPRKTQIQELEDIDKRSASLNNIRVGWDRKNGYIGTSIKSEDFIKCNEYDHLVCIEKNGKFKVISIPQKLYVGKLYYFNRYDSENIYSIIYKEKKTSNYYVKNSEIKQFIRDKEYDLVPTGCQLEQLTIRENSIYECTLEAMKKQKKGKVTVNFAEVQTRNPGARGFKFTNRKIKKINFIGFAEVNDDLDEPVVNGDLNIELDDLAGDNAVNIDAEQGINQGDIDKQNKKRAKAFLKSIMSEMQQEQDSEENEVIEVEKPDVTTEIQKDSDDSVEPENELVSNDEIEDEEVLPVEIDTEEIEDSAEEVAIDESDSENSDNIEVDVIEKSRYDISEEKIEDEAPTSSSINDEELIEEAEDTEVLSQNEDESEEENNSKADDSKDSDKDDDADDWGVVQLDLGF